MHRGLWRKLPALDIKHTQKLATRGWFTQVYPLLITFKDDKTITVEYTDDASRSCDIVRIAEAQQKATQRTE